MGKKYSVVMPVYLRERRHKAIVEKTIKSIKQHSSDYEFIIVNDGSPLNCDFLKEAADKYIVQENKGISASWNAGKNNASCEYVAIINDDIEVPYMWLDELGNAFEEKEVGVSAPFKGGPTIYPFRSKTMPTTYNHKFYPGYCFMLKRDRFFEDFDEQFVSNCGDVDYWHRIRQAGLKLARAPFEIKHLEGDVLHFLDYDSINTNSLQLFIKKWGFNPQKEYYS